MDPPTRPHRPFSPAPRRIIPLMAVKFESPNHSPHSAPPRPSSGIVPLMDIVFPNHPPFTASPPSPRLMSLMEKPTRKLKFPKRPHVFSAPAPVPQNIVPLMEIKFPHQIFPSPSPPPPPLMSLKVKPPRKFVPQSPEITHKNVSPTGGLVLSICTPKNRVKFSPSSTVCSRCHKTSGHKLGKCSTCNRARYCGINCQAAHWPIHHHFCTKATPIENCKSPPKKSVSWAPTTLFSP